MELTKLNSRITTKKTEGKKNSPRRNRTLKHENPQICGRKKAPKTENVPYAGGNRKKNTENDVRTYVEIPRRKEKVLRGSDVSHHLEVALQTARNRQSPSCILG